MRKNILDKLDVLYERACMAIQSTISDPGYFDSEEQVDSKSKSGEQDEAISDSKEQVDAVSEAKAYREYSLNNESETMNVLGSRINSPN